MNITSPNKLKTQNLASFIIFSILLMVVATFSGCKVNYSFTGANIGTAKTVSVKYFVPVDVRAKATYGQTFTEALKDIMTSQGKLQAVSNGGDMDLEGGITGYVFTPVSIATNDQAQQTRLTVTVSVKFTNSTDEKKNFETTFSRYADFNSSLNIATVEDELLRQITTQLVQDVFNKAVINW